MSEKEKTAAAATQGDSRIDRLEAVVEKLTLAVTTLASAATSAPAARPAAKPQAEKSSQQEFLATYQRELNVRINETFAIDAQAREKLEDGPRKFEVCVRNIETGDIHNRKCLVGAESPQHAEAKYREFFGITGVASPSRMEVSEALTAV